MRNFLNLLHCILIRQGHYFCPWYRRDNDFGTTIRRRCRDCGLTQKREAPYLLWSSTPKENILL